MNRRALVEIFADNVHHRFLERLALRTSCPYQVFAGPFQLEENIDKEVILFQGDVIVDKREIVDLEDVFERIFVFELFVRDHFQQKVLLHEFLDVVQQLEEVDDLIDDFAENALHFLIFVAGEVVIDVNQELSEPGFAEKGIGFIQKLEEMN